MMIWRSGKTRCQIFKRLHNFALLFHIFCFWQHYDNAYEEKPTNNPSATVDAALFAKLKYYVQYAAAAYCSNNDDSSGTPITCGTGNCPDVQAANAVSVLEFDR